MFFIEHTSQLLIVTTFTRNVQAAKQQEFQNIRTLFFIFRSHARRPRSFFCLVLTTNNHILNFQVINVIYNLKKFCLFIFMFMKVNFNVRQLLSPSLRHVLYIVWIHLPFLINYHHSLSRQTVQSRPSKSREYQIQDDVPFFYRYVVQF